MKGSITEFGLIRATFDSLAQLLSVSPDQVGEALGSERLVKRQISRRGLFVGCGAMAAAAALPSGKAFGEICAGDDFYAPAAVFGLLPVMVFGAFLRPAMSPMGSMTSDGQTLYLVSLP